MALVGKLRWFRGVLRLNPFIYILPQHLIACSVIILIDILYTNSVTHLPRILKIVLLQNSYFILCHKTQYFRACSRLLVLYHLLVFSDKPEYSSARNKYVLEPRLLVLVLESWVSVLVLVFGLLGPRVLVLHSRADCSTQASILPRSVKWVAMFQFMFCPWGYKTCGGLVKPCDRIKHGELFEGFEDL